ncbi:hypothetical protein QAD02_018913 [Eretmocerus hayati]|uniref:Uncharacterized protein n=1 Tax=Eretmocerus hayati TaxID=131215 RepID=A0ACC2PI46_9HYME|nr:hypothetical protein QAD02_018913 [Eretmocerus hayati]
MQRSELVTGLLLAQTSALLLLSAGAHPSYMGPFHDQRPNTLVVSAQVPVTNSATSGGSQLSQSLGYVAEGSGGAGGGGGGGGNEKRAAGGEPTCEELRAMWRYSKRQSRAAESSNELPVYRDPFSYNVWDSSPTHMQYPGYRDEYPGPARSRGAGGAPIYGKVVTKAPAGSRLRNGAELARIFGKMNSSFGTVQRQSAAARHFRVGGSGNAGPHPPQAGSFEDLKQMILRERSKELREQRAAEEAARMVKGIEPEQRQSSYEARNANFLNSLKEYLEPNDLASQSQYVPESRSLSKTEQYGRGGSGGDYTVR